MYRASAVVMTPWDITHIYDNIKSLILEFYNVSFWRDVIQWYSSLSIRLIAALGVAVGAADLCHLRLWYHIQSLQWSYRRAELKRLPASLDEALVRQVFMVQKQKEYNKTTEIVQKQYINTRQLQAWCNPQAFFPGYYWQTHWFPAPSIACSCHSLTSTDFQLIQLWYINYSQYSHSS